MSRNGVLCALAQAIPNSPTRAAGLSISVVAWDRMWTYRRPFSDYHPVGTSFSHFVFAAAMQGTLTLDNDLLAVFKVFGLSRRARLTDLYLPHLVAWLFPAWITALGTSWKVVVMAELLSTADGVGGALAVSRAQLDTSTTLAWVVTVLAALLLLEYLCLEPIKRKVEGWRERGTCINETFSSART